LGLIRSPDGRVWAVDRVRPSIREAETLKIPFFWTSVVVTIVLFAVAIRVVVVDPGRTALLYLLPLVVWILERGMHMLRPYIRASTDGPPREVLYWRPNGRFGYGRIERRIAQAIESGRPEQDVRGAPVVRLG
jgi:hypothetical protein